MGKRKSESCRWRFGLIARRAWAGWEEVAGDGKAFDDFGQQDTSDLLRNRRAKHQPGTAISSCGSFVWEGGRGPHSANGRLGRGAHRSGNPKLSIDPSVRRAARKP